MHNLRTPAPAYYPNPNYSDVPPECRGDALHGDPGRPPATRRGVSQVDRDGEGVPGGGEEGEGNWSLLITENQEGLTSWR